MPTGYTAALYDGKEQTFRDFALDCARNFGALISLIDDRNAEIPDVIESDTAYYEKQLAKAEAEYAKTLKENTYEKWEKEYDKFVKEELAKAKKQDENALALKERYEDMVRKAEAWQPPTEEHEGLKKFMISQLKDSIKFDCNSYPTQLPDKEEWIMCRVSGQIAKENIEYYKYKIQKEKESARRKTEWIQQLKKSLE